MRRVLLLHLWIQFKFSQSFVNQLFNWRFPNTVLGGVCLGFAWIRDGRLFSNLYFFTLYIYGETLHQAIKRLQHQILNLSLYGAGVSIILQSFYWFYYIREWRHIYFYLFGNTLATNCTIICHFMKYIARIDLSIILWKVL